MRAFFAIPLIALTALSAQAGEGFPTMRKFESLSVHQMAQLPEIRVPLCRGIDARTVQGRSKLELSLMKNSIFAQVGYKFTNASYRRYFLSRRWYNENAGYRADRLCAVDKDNAQMLSSLIAKAKDRATDDSGNGYGEDGYGYGEEGYGEGGYGYGNRL